MKLMEGNNTYIYIYAFLQHHILKAKERINYNV